MTEETTQEQNSEIIDLIPANFHIQPRAFVYEVKLPEDTFFISVLAASSTEAVEGLKKQLPPETPIHFMCSCKHIIQIS